MKIASVKICKAGKNSYVYGLQKDRLVKNKARNNSKCFKIRAPSVVIYLHTAADSAKYRS
jgi:hypothetical protein